MGRHEEWRKIAKRERRRKIRQIMAKKAAQKEKDEDKLKLADLDYQMWLNEQNYIDKLYEKEVELRNDEENEKWLRAELIAQKQWRELQEKIQRAKLERQEQELRIKKEWELEQAKVREVEEKIKKEAEEQEKKKEDFRRRVEEFLNGNASPPRELLVIVETKPYSDLCPFFNKTGVCRFGDSCSRNHKYPGISKTLLAPNFFSFFGLEHANPKNYENDISLEFDEDESNREFRDFFFDVLPEFERWGEIVQFRVCNNFEKHLRGNVYVEYANLRSAVSAHRALNARWYGGKQISLQFTNINDWNSALCGLYWRKKCPKGQNCNFLHVYRNPRNMFSVDLNKVEDPSQSKSRISRPRDWRWSESPERSDKRKSRSRCRSPNTKKKKKNDFSGNEMSRERSRGRRSGSRDRDRRSHKRKSSRYSSESDKVSVKRRKNNK